MSQSSPSSAAPASSRRELVERRPAGTRQTKRRPSELAVLLKNKQYTPLPQVDQAKPAAMVSAAPAQTLPPSVHGPETFPDESGAFVTKRRKRHNRKLSYSATSPTAALQSGSRSDDSVLLLPE